LYLYLATLVGKRVNRAAGLYAENDEHAQQRVQAWWEEMCRSEPYLLDECVAPTIERKTHYLRSGRREHPPIIEV
jgi:hypothetical protein